MLDKNITSLEIKIQSCEEELKRRATFDNLTFEVIGKRLSSLETNIYQMKSWITSLETETKFLRALIRRQDGRITQLEEDLHGYIIPDPKDE